jgi:uncharacterized protein (TIGR02466 family)
MLQITEMFAVPFGFAKFPNCGALNDELHRLFLTRESEGQAYANPRPFTQRNRQVFESRFDLFRWPDACVQSLKDFCWGHLTGFVGELNGYDAAMRERLLIYSDAWFHVTRRGGFFGLYNHAMAAWSGVYCVNPGRNDADKPDSGLLSFVNPFLASAMYLDVSTAKLRPPFAYHIRHVKMEPGQLVLFPAWLLHDVKPFEGDGERVTVAFNCWFSLEGAPNGA